MPRKRKLKPETRIAHLRRDVRTLKSVLEWTTRELRRIDVLKQEVRELEQQRDRLSGQFERLKREHEADAQAFFDLKSDYGRACNERDLLRGQIEAGRVAVRALVAQVDNLGAFADNNDPRVMATVAPLGAAQADLYLALGLSLDDEHARMQADIESRCAVCGWSLAEDIGQGCTRGCCSMRPRPEKLYAPERAAREAEDLKERALRNGMPPSGRWA